MSTHQTCEAVAVRCIDFRIQKHLNEYLDERFPKAYDCISIAGGVKHLLSDEEEHSAELNHLLISRSLHNPKIVILIQHEDCGAYGGCAAFEHDFEKEMEHQIEQMEKAENMLRKHFPEAIVEKFLVRLSGEILPV